jgi:hypothetical protein
MRQGVVRGHAPNRACVGNGDDVCRLQRHPGRHMRQFGDLPVSNNTNSK